jgi:hypothetical protein
MAATRTLYRVTWRGPARARTPRVEAVTALIGAKDPLKLGQFRSMDHAEREGFCATPAGAVGAEIRHLEAVGQKTDRLRALLGAVKGSDTSGE